MQLTILETTFCSVKVADEEGNTSWLHRLRSGKWRCLRCERLRCEHGRLVKRMNPDLPPPPPPTKDIDIETY